MNFLDKWNKSKFNVYESEEKTVLKLITKISDFIFDLSKGVDSKTDNLGDHKGTWFGFKPTEVGEYLQSMVEVLNVKVQNFDFKYIEEFGVITPGDNTTILQTAINYCSENKIILNLGTTEIFATNILIPSNTIIEGGVLKGATDSNLLNLQGENIYLKNVKIDGLNTINDAITIISSKNVVIENCSITKCKGKGINVLDSSYVEVNNNKIINIIGQAIEFTFSSNCKAFKNEIDNAMHGIQFWGGDSAIEDIQGVESLLILSNNVKNVVGGIWGSLGKNIIINNNIVENCSDVGIDFEGCSNSNAIGNSVKNCVNGGLAVFYGGYNISFSSNNIIQEINSPCIKMFGSNKMIKNVSINSNIISGNQGIYTDENSCTQLAISNNEFINEGISIQLIKCSSNVISNNIFNCKAARTINIDGGKNNLIEGNTFHSSYLINDLPSESGAIYLSWSNATYDISDNVIINNLINDYYNSITIDSWGWDSGGKCVIKNNHLKKINVKAPGAGFQGVCKENTLINSPTTPVEITNF